MVGTIFPARSYVLAKSFKVLDEPVQKSDVVVTGRPFIPPLQKITHSTDQIKATQSIEAPSASSATQPVESPSVTTVRAIAAHGPGC